MKLLVTGGAGFIGSHLMRRWSAFHPDDSIVNLDALTYAGTLERLVEADDSLLREPLEAHPGHRQFIKGDVCDPAKVREALEGVDVVIHCAAETHVDRSITNTAPFIRTNVEGTRVLLEQVRLQPVKRFLYISTDEVYGPILQGAVDEQAPLRPQSPYAASKAAADLLVQAFHATFGLPVIIARPTNVFGISQLPEKFIPLCIMNAIEGRPLPLYGDGQQRRCWLFVDDLCDALMAIAAQGTIGQIYNIGSGCEQTNLETARQILAALPATTSQIQFVADRPGHDRRYSIDDTKLRTLLGWKPGTLFPDGLRQTIEWYDKFRGLWLPITQRLREDPYHWLNRPARSSAHQPSGALL